jgi:hypothetical protein
MARTQDFQELFMAKLIQLQDAAKILGISPEELTDMRSRNEIFGYRDGTTWKFKIEELERVKAARAMSAESLHDLPTGEELEELVDVGDLSLEGDDLTSEPDSDHGATADDDADVIEMSSGDDSDSILVSEEVLGQSDENTASTIIGEADDLLPHESGIAGSDALAGGSDLELSMEKSDALSASDIFEEGARKPTTASDTASLNVASSSDIAEGVTLQDSGSLELARDDSGIGSRIELADDDAQASSSGFGSAIELGLDDDELVLGSGAGSDVTAGAGDSGISLGNPSDSGLSLEEPLGLSEGSGVESLELGEDELLNLSDSAATGAAADDDFMLTPVEDAVDEESDSGSQVIALDSEDFDDSAVEMLTEEGEDLEEAETAEFVPDGGDVAAGAAVSLAAARGEAGTIGDEEANYSVWNVLSLLGIVMLLSFTGVLMLDLINNMWSWQGNFSFSSTIMDAILNLMP